MRDPSAFVQATITRARLVLSPDERAELHAEGLAILHKLAADYKPHIEGHVHEGRFSGYAAMFLARKLGDAWHRLHPEHMLVTQPDGRRRWIYGERTASLEAMSGEHPDRSELLASESGESEGSFERRVDGALREWDARYRELTVKVAVLLGQGATESDVAQTLRISSQEVREHMLKLGRVAPYLESQA